MAEEAYEICIALGLQKNVKGFIVQKNYFKQNNLFDTPVYNEDILEKLDREHYRLISAIGSLAREEWIEKLEQKNFLFATIIHPTAVIGSEVSLSSGVIVGAGAVLTSNITVGKHVIINIASTISHDTKIGEFSTISPGVHIAGRVKIGKGVFIGIGSSIIPDCVLGDGVFVGAGSVVVSNLSANTLYYGSPARKIRKLSYKDISNMI